MARSVQEIQAQIISTIQATPELAVKLTSTSMSAIWRQFTYVVAVAHQTIESLWDAFRIEIDERIAQTRVHNRKWYKGKALDFQFGFTLGESDVYDNTGYTDEEIAASKIIANAAVLRLVQNGYGIVRIKAVKKVNDELAPLTEDEITAFRAYWDVVADAGTTVVATTGEADQLKARIDIYFDPQVLSSTGARLDGTDDSPVINGIKAFLKSQEFDGKLIRRQLENHLETIPGVVVPKIVDLWTKYGNYGYDTVGIQSVGIVDEMRTPDSGYLKLDEIESLIEFIPIE